MAAWAAGRPASLKHLTEAHISLNFRARQRGAGSLAVMAGLLPHPPCPSYAARHRSHTAGSSNITTIVFLPVVSDVPCSPGAGAAVTPPGTPKPSSPPPHSEALGREGRSLLPARRLTLELPLLLALPLDEALQGPAVLLLLVLLRRHLLLLLGPAALHVRPAAPPSRPAHTAPQR